MKKNCREQEPQHNRGDYMKRSLLIKIDSLSLPLGVYARKEALCFRLWIAPGKAVTSKKEVTAFIFFAIFALIASLDAQARLWRPTRKGWSPFLQGIVNQI